MLLSILILIVFIASGCGGGSKAPVPTPAEELKKRQGQKGEFAVVIDAEPPLLIPIALLQH